MTHCNHGTVTTALSGHCSHCNQPEAFTSDLHITCQYSLNDENYSWQLRVNMAECRQQAGAMWWTWTEDWWRKTRIHRFSNERLSTATAYIPWWRHENSTGDLTYNCYWSPSAQWRFINQIIIIIITSWIPALRWDDDISCIHTDNAVGWLLTVYFKMMNTSLRVLSEPTMSYLLLPDLPFVSIY